MIAPHQYVLSRRDHLKTCLGLGAASVLASATAWAAAPQDSDAKQVEQPEPTSGLIRYVQPKTSRYRCGLKLDVGRANCRGVVSTFPVLRDWPEQQVELIEEAVDPLFARWTIRELGDGLVSQFVTQVPLIRAGTVADALLTYRVTRSMIVGPTEDEQEKLDKLTAPDRGDKELSSFFGSSPQIDPGSGRIRAAVRELEKTPETTTWARVEQVYDWVREKINYVVGEIKSADQALKDGSGDCEELTSVFIAICRAMRIPARMVYVLRHCYPEFYLVDESGVGTWFPCQVAGTRQFGSMEEYRPILQKGDRFRVPEQGQERYVAEYFKAAAVVGGKPKPVFVQEELD